MLQTQLDALIELLRDDDIAVREAAQGELGRVAPFDDLRRRYAQEADVEARARLAVCVRRRLDAEWAAGRVDDAIAALATLEASHVRERLAAVSAHWERVWRDDPILRHQNWARHPTLRRVASDLGLHELWVLAAARETFAGSDDRHHARLVLLLFESHADVDLIVPLLQDRNASVRLAVAAVLRGWKDERALPALKEAYRTDSDDAARARMAEAITTITRKPLEEALRD